MIKKISIKSHGVTTTVPSEIFVTKGYGSIKDNTHLVLDECYLDNLKYFALIRENGFVVYDRYFSINYINSIEYKELSLDKYYKLRAFL